VVRPAVAIRTSAAPQIVTHAVGRALVAIRSIGETLRCAADVISGYPLQLPLCAFEDRQVERASQRDVIDGRTVPVRKGVRTPSLLVYTRLHEPEPNHSPEYEMPMSLPSLAALTSGSGWLSKCWPTVIDDIPAANAAWKARHAPVKQQSIAKSLAGFICFLHFCAGIILHCGYVCKYPRGYPANIANSSAALPQA